MILHLVSFEEKFMGYLVGYFESFNAGKNVYLVHLEHENQIPSGKYPMVNYCPSNSNAYLNIISDWDKYDVVITYGLDLFRCKHLSTLPPSLPFAWVIFGFEVYNVLSPYKYQLFFEMSYKLAMEKEVWAKKWAKKLFTQRYVDTLLNKVKQCFFKQLPVENQIKQVLKRADYIGDTIPNQTRDIKTAFSLPGKWIGFTFYNIEETITSGLKDTKINNNNILLGNSGTATNNHYEILEFLAKKKLGNRKVLVPLGYGDKEYVKRITTLGYQFLPDHFEPINYFLPRSAYNELIVGCSWVIMNHRRQQALGTILTMLWFGATVFLNEENPIFEYLTELDIKVYSIRKHLCFDTVSDQPIEYEELVRQRSVLYKEFGKDAVFKRNQKFFQVITATNH